MKKNVLLGGLLLFASFMMAQSTIDNAFFEKVKFRGAFGSTDWTTGWSNFNPKTTAYSTPDKTVNAGIITANTTWGYPKNSAFSDASIANPFFENVGYVGAFGKTDWTAGWANFNPQTTVYPATTVTINAGDITTNTTWTKNNVYLLNGWVYVKSGATLTIEAGTVIRGDKTSMAALMIEKGAKLIANGTAAEPIIFTSNVAAGSRASGDWGGIILCGLAPINPTGGSATIEGGVGSTYGGSDAADNSGSLQYVRIEFPGFPFQTDKEINGLTMGGVGSGTTIDYIQVSYSDDDSFEWFGGTVNAKHLIALAGKDDDFDTDFGYSGMVQFAVSLRDPNIADASGSNSFESDNDASGSTNSPFTSAVFSNVSSFGPLATPSTTISSNYKRALHLRRTTKLKIFNSLFAGWPTGLYIDGNTTQANATAGDLKMQNCIFGGMTANYGVPASQTWDVAAETAWYNNIAFKNETVVANADLKITDPFTLTAPNFLPTATSKMLAQSYWQFTPVPGLANNMNLYVKAYANGSQITTLGSMLMAYKNGECRGADEVLGNGVFSLLAMSDLNSESDLDLKLYDAATKKMYDLPTVFDFVSDSEVATFEAPATLTATGSLTIPLTTGTNWISFNVLPENSVVTKDVLNYSPTSGDVITKQGGQNATLIGTSWVGAISSIEKNKMYKLKCKGANPGSISVLNQALTANTPISLTTGINWIGYSPVEQADVTVALSGYTPTSGDKVTTNAAGGQTITYSGSSWFSTKPTLYPGRGYALKSLNGGTLTFPRRVLNNSNLNRILSFESSKISLSDQSVWSEPTGKANNMTIYAKLFST